MDSPGPRGGGKLHSAARERLYDIGSCGDGMKKGEAKSTNHQAAVRIHVAQGYQGDAVKKKTIGQLCRRGIKVHDETGTNLKTRS